MRRRLVEVRWQDHCLHGGQHSGVDLLALVEQESVGYFVSEDSDVIKLCMGFTDNKDPNDVLVIDKRMVIKRTFIRRG